MYETCLTSQMRARRSCIRFAFPALWEMTKIQQKKSSWIINNLLDVLVCIIVECFYLFLFWLALRNRQNTAQIVKIPSDATHQNVLYDEYIPGANRNTATLT